AALDPFNTPPKQAIAEARAVLRTTGVALISVPYLNPARRASLAQARANNGDKELEFYQYYYSYEEFTSLLRAGGLQVVDHWPLFVDHMLVREHPVFAWYWRSPFCRFRMREPI